jgi:hypothetical protein
MLQICSELLVSIKRFTKGATGSHKLSQQLSKAREKKRNGKKKEHGMD